MASSTRKLKPSCVKQIYVTACSSKFPWEDILEEKLFDYVDTYAHAFSCPISVSIPSVLGAIAALVGPDTSVECRGEEFKLPLNLYNFIVSVPGGGKSVAFSKIVMPALDEIHEKHNCNIHLESYSSAGLQRQQGETAGRALLTSDEGQRLLAAMNAKQMRSEGERALLNKLSGGQGDSTVLLEKDRGMKKSSFSMIIFVQPAPLLAEMLPMSSEDGFFDRVLTFVSKPKLAKAKESREAVQKLKALGGTECLYKVLVMIFEWHRTGAHAYKLSTAAQAYFDEISDEHVTEFNEMYDSGEFPIDNRVFIFNI